MLLLFFIYQETSDFAAACGRARAFAELNARAKFDIGSSTSPEPSPNALDNDRFDFPVSAKDPAAETKKRFESAGSFDEDELLKNAKRDIAACLGLAVSNSGCLWAM